MTTLLEEMHAEVLRWLYALSTRGWPAALTELTPCALLATFVLVALRLRGAMGPHGPRSATPRREDA